MRPLTLTLVACFGLVLSSSACKRDRAQAVAASYSSVTKPTPFVAPPLSAIGMAAIPVQEEYEERAQADITPENLSAKVAEIEKELGIRLPSAPP